MSLLFTAPTKISITAKAPNSSSSSGLGKSGIAAPGKASHTSKRKSEVVMRSHSEHSKLKKQKVKDLEATTAAVKKRRAVIDKGMINTFTGVSGKEIACIRKEDNDIVKQESNIVSQGCQPTQRFPRKSSTHRLVFNFEPFNVILEMCGICLEMMPDNIFLSFFRRAFADCFVESDYARVYKTTSKRRAMLDKDGKKSDTSSTIPSAERSPDPCPKVLTSNPPKSLKERTSHGENAQLEVEESGHDNKLPLLSRFKRTFVDDEGPRQIRPANKASGKGAGKRRSQRHFMGVQATPSGRFKAKIYVPRTKKHIYIGIYDSPEEAAHAYDEVAYRKRGATAPLNFPESFHAKIRDKQPTKKVLIQLTDAGDFEAMCYNPTLKDYHSVGVFSSVDAARRAGAREAATMDSSIPQGSDRDEGRLWSPKLDITSESKPMKGKRSKSLHLGTTPPPASSDVEEAGADEDDNDPVPETDSQKASFRSMRSKNGTFSRVCKNKKLSRRGNMTRRADFRGVYCNGHKFQSIYYNPATKKHTYLGTFLTAEEAARAHDQVMSNITH